MEPQLLHHDRGHDRPIELLDPKVLLDPFEK
jgi:hypothetical protein